MTMEFGRFPVQGQEVVPPSPASGGGQFNPYRGVDVHGVHSSEVWEDVPAVEADTVKVPVEEREQEHDPIPVRIVREYTKELRTHRVNTVPIKPNGEVTQVVGRHDVRTSVKVVNIGTVTVYVVNDRSGTAFNGYPIPVNGNETFTDEDALYMVNDGSGTPGNVTTLEFLSVKE